MPTRRKKSSDKNRASERLVKKRKSSIQRRSALKITGASISARDITDQKRGEASLEQALEWQKAIFEGSKDAILIADSEDRFVAVNKAACILTGYSRAELLKMRIVDLHEEQDLAAYKQFRNRIMTGEPIISEARINRKDGLKVDTEFSNSRVIIAGIPYMHTTARDITERKQSESALRSSEAQFSNALEIAHLGPWEYDVGKDLFTFNDHFYRMFRTTAEKEGGYTMSSAHYSQRFVHPDEPLIVAGEIRKAIDSTDPQFSRQLEHRILYADGEIGYISVQFFIVKDSEGRTVKTYGVNQDITGRKRAEEALRASEERYRRLFDGDLAGVYFSTPSGKLISCNAAFARIFRFKSVDDALATDTHELYSNPEARELFLQSVRQSRRLELQESWLKRRDGTDMHVIENARGVFDDQGELIEIQGYLLDDTERKQAEESVRESEERFRMVFENVLDGISIYEEDPDPSKRRLVECNQRYASMAGRSREELLQRGNTQQLQITHEETANIKRVESLAAGKAYQGSFSWIRPDGKDNIVEYVGVPITWRGKSHSIGIDRDITVRKKTELVLKSSHAQLHALAVHLQSVREDERTNLARALHDELGQLLTGLKMELSFLDKTPKNQESMRLQEMKNAKVDSMNKLIDKAIEAVRGISLELRPAILDSLGLSAALEWLANDFQQKSGIVCTSCIKSDAVFDSESSTVMFRIAQEALTNVVRHSKAKKATITLASEQNEASLSVRDDGIGMTTEQIGDVRSLGLLGIRERAAAIGGTITIDSTIGKGTTITLRIPLSRSKDTARTNPGA